MQLKKKKVTLNRRLKEFYLLLDTSKSDYTNENLIRLNNIIDV